LTSVSLGNTWEKAGSNKTSSKVNPSPKNFVGELDFFAGVIILAMCKDRAGVKYVPKKFPPEH
jgi:hypothetical protein